MQAWHKPPILKLGAKLLRVSCGAMSALRVLTRLWMPYLTQVCGSCLAFNPLVHNLERYGQSCCISTSLDLAPLLHMGALALHTASSHCLARMVNCCVCAHFLH